MNKNYVDLAPHSGPWTTRKYSYLYPTRMAEERCWRKKTILLEAKVAYYAPNMFEAGRIVLFVVKATWRHAMNPLRWYRGRCQVTPYRSPGCADVLRGERADVTNFSYMTLMDTPWSRIICWKYKQMRSLENENENFSDTLDTFLQHHGVASDEEYADILHAGINQPTVQLRRTMAQKQVMVSKWCSFYSVISVHTLGHSLCQWLSLVLPVNFTVHCRRKWLAIHIKAVLLLGGCWK